jgi:hypothetical protein
MTGVTAFNIDADTETRVFDLENGKLLQEKIKERNVVQEPCDDSAQNLIFHAHKNQPEQMYTDENLKRAMTGFKCDGCFLCAICVAVQVCSNRNRAKVHQ